MQVGKQGREKERKKPEVQNLMSHEGRHFLKIALSINPVDYSS